MRNDVENFDKLYKYANVKLLNMSLYKLLSFFADDIDIVVDAWADFQAEETVTMPFVFKTFKSSD